ncbi:class I SAM-dependent methyltransferase [Minwuia sp.]|uniref:class I SAM-dependent methyltransferase n=1 Tax=Minwuia sp. TaxID=2493630 RepID=UPI003A93886D
MNAPDIWIKRHIDLVPDGGRVLDIAAGEGRHVALCRTLGLKVVAVDRDVSGLQQFRNDDDVTILEADLEDRAWPLPGERFDGIIVCNYLWRALFPTVLDCLAPGGCLIWTTFATGNEAFGRPRNPDFLLRRNELLQRVLPELEVLAYSHGLVHRPTPAVRQSIAARRPDVDHTSAG